jgi:plastocyanin
MKTWKLAAGATGLVAAVACTGVAVAANTAAAPRSVTVKQKFGLTLKPNRYLQDEMRFDKDVYTVKSGGKVVFELTAPQEGPHTLSIVRAKDEPKTGAQLNHCKICEKLGQAHGADPNSDAPPKFPYLENGVGQATPEKIDRPGDSGISGDKKGDKVTFTVTAKAGTTLHFMCLLHPWMQAQLKVVK